MISDPRYVRWIEYRKRMKSPAMTNTQYRFALWLFSCDKHIIALGNLTDIFVSVRQFLKEDNKREDDGCTKL